MAALRSSARRSRSVRSAPATSSRKPTPKDETYSGVPPPSRWYAAGRPRADRVEDPWIGAAPDHAVGPGDVEPSRGVIVAKPARDEHRMVRHAIGPGQEGVHELRALPLVALVHAVDASRQGMTLP